MEKFLLLLVLLFHSAKTDRFYESECPAIKPMPNFDMNRVRVCLNSQFFLLSE